MKRETTKKMKLKSFNCVLVMIMNPSVLADYSLQPADLQCGTGVRALIFQLHQTGSGGNDGA